MKSDSDSALIVFVKKPEAGRVKTRLAAGIGDAQALTVYERLLAHTYRQVVGVDAAVYVYCTEAVESLSGWSEDDYTVQVQAGADLGERMKRAFAERFEAGAERVCIIGSDCYDLMTGHLREAFRLLHTNDLIVGPAEDGGYYLLGMSNFLPEMFDDIAWSTPTVLSDTLAKADQLNLRTAALPTLRDIDDIDDLRHYPELMNGLTV